ncbi:MAG: hypothetical protein A2Z21_10015 [Candidatus Fraserbacteria bacterium RBG_16_55_9]|uniref:DinB-like domain-containing protein n=1 Tax=Fraserbacteria sp. (strain RBG_16_55_9) TaxID=1817864 RepID=A0A1F5UVF6_FRAXR|nr:MAG: hypothetical protein A2Z21_10015 [Candidatus Fraserbacteria bacterium RBG_16_55_9]
MDLSTLDRLFQQIQEGWDIPTPQGLLRVKQEDAAVTLPNLPYSMVKNLAHVVYWQELMLKALAGEHRPPQMEVWKNDYRDPDPSEWPDLRRRFVAGFERARAYCGPGFSAHKLKSDQEAVDTLLTIAIHASYHMGQLNILKRAGRAATRR